MPLDAQNDLQQAYDTRLRRQKRNERADFTKGLMQGINPRLKPYDVVPEVGANMGAVTVPLAATDAQVHAYEPDPYALGRLQKATTGLETVTMHNAAAGATSGRIQSMRASNFDDNSSTRCLKGMAIRGARKINETEGATIPVDLIALPEVIRDPTATQGEGVFLRMDVEGAKPDLSEHRQSNPITDVTLDRI